MMRQFFLLVLLLCLWSGTSQAQMGTMKWQFKDRDAVRAAVRANARNVGNSYNIILSARRQGMIRSAVQEYEALVNNQTFGLSPELCSSYAFAHHIMSAPIGWNIPFDKARGIVKDDQSAALKVGWYREKALKERPNSPIVLLEYAIWQFDQNGGSPRALRLVERAIKVRPKWAEAHYWHAEILGRHADNNLPESQKEKLLPQYGKAMIRAMQKAEPLDSSFKDIGLGVRYSAYERMNEPRNALIYFDAYAKKYPEYVSYLNNLLGPNYFQKRREGLIAQVNANR